MDHLTLSHPEEAEMLRAVADGLRDDYAHIPNYHCYGCQEETAYYLSAGPRWYLPCYQCRCGWWLPAAEYDALHAECLGLNDTEVA